MTKSNTCHLAISNEKESMTKSNTCHLAISNEKETKFQLIFSKTQGMSSSATYIYTREHLVLLKQGAKLIMVFVVAGRGKRWHAFCSQAWPA